MQYLQNKMTKNSPVKDLPLIGDVKAKHLEKLGISTIGDLLFHIPFKYRDTSNIVSIEKLKETKEGTILAKVEDISNVFTKYRKVITRAKLSDESGSVNAVWFNQVYLTKTIKKDSVYLFEGKISPKTANLTSPSYELFMGDLNDQKHIGKITPYYNETATISSKWIRGRIGTLKKEVDRIIDEPFPSEILKENNLMGLSQAIHCVHFPDNFEHIKQARERLAFDEMISIALKIEQKSKERKNRNAVLIIKNEQETEKYINNLPYKLTKDQESAIDQILSDISKDIPMNRLLNGDVGSGKTVVSAVAMYNTFLNHQSCLLMAPTTILATQHFNTLQELFKNTKVNIELRISGKKLTNISKPSIIVGTHALLFENKLPNDIGLIIVDEQHRFGVKQREQLVVAKLDGTYPHFLMMTATPIPHTLTNILFGDMDVSLIREMPKGRLEVKSHFVPFEKRNDCYTWVAQKIISSKYKEQAFIVFPLIEESEKIDAKAAVAEYEKLSKNQLKDLKVCLLHGQMKQQEKDKILEDFKNKKYNILVSTSVIEVGIDIPHATIMVIESAQRFGLAQLHQFRGRVGRSNIQSYCFVISGENTPANTKSRLKYFASHSSGFDVAQYDLQKRGPGEVYGLRQSGIPQFKVASINDLELLIKARKVSKQLIEQEYNLEGIFK